MKKFIYIFSFIATLFSSGDAWGAGNFCYNETYPLEDLYAKTGGCWTTSNAYDKVEGIRFGVDIPGQTQHYWYDAPVTNTFDLNTLYSAFQIYVNTWNVAISNNQFTVDVYYLKFSNSGSCTLDSDQFNWITPILLSATVPDLCPTQIVNFNDYIDASSVAYGVGNFYGGTWSVSGLSVNSGGTCDLNGATSGVYVPTYSKSIPNTTCVVTKTFDPFTIYDTESIFWTGTPPTSVIDSDPPFSLMPYITVTNGTPTVVGDGAYQDNNGDWWFDPSATVGLSSVSLSSYVTSPNGCDYDNANNLVIAITHDPGTPLAPILDLDYDGLSNYQQYWPTFSPDYTDNSTSTPPFFTVDINAHYTKILGRYKSVCSGTDSIRLKIGAPEPGFTYKWFITDNGFIEHVHTGNTFSHPLSEETTFTQKNFYFSAVSNLGVEGVKNILTVNINPNPSLANDTTVFCHDGVDTTVYMPINYTHNTSNDFLVGGVIDTNRVERVSTYNWYFNNSLINRGNSLYMTWDNISKVGTVNYTRIDSMYAFGGAHPFSGGSFNPQALTPGTQSVPYYTIYGCECESIDTGVFFFVKKPESGFSSNVIGELNIGQAVQFIDTSLFKTNSTNINWSFGDGSYDYYGDTLWHYYNEYGSFNINQNVVDEYGCYDLEQKNNYLYITDFASTVENSHETLEVYPNPTNGIVTVISDEYNNIEVTNMSGQKIGVEINNGEIDFSNLENGVYLLKVNFDSGSVIKKIVKR